MYGEDQGKRVRKRGEGNNKDNQTRTNELNRVEITANGTEEASTSQKFFCLDPTGGTLCPVRYRKKFQEIQFGDSWQSTHVFFKKEITNNNLG